MEKTENLSTLNILHDSLWCHPGQLNAGPEENIPVRPNITAGLPEAEGKLSDFEPIPAGIAAGFNHTYCSNGDHQITTGVLNACKYRWEVPDDIVSAPMRSFVAGISTQVIIAHQ